MSSCPNEQKLGVYHDGQLPAAERTALAMHIEDCPACELILSRLSAMSRLFAESAPPGLSQIAHARLSRRMDAVMDRGLLRIAWTLSGLAASVLVIGSVFMMNMAHAPAAAPPWVGVADAVDSTQLQREPATPAAEWYLANADSPSDDAQ